MVTAQGWVWRRRRSLWPNDPVREAGWISGAPERTTGTGTRVGDERGNPPSPARPPEGVALAREGFRRFLGWSDAVEGRRGAGAGTRLALGPGAAGGRRPGSGRSGPEAQENGEGGAEKACPGRTPEAGRAGWQAGDEGGHAGASEGLGERDGLLYTSRLQRASGGAVW